MGKASSPHPDILIKRGGVSATVDTFQKLKKMRPIKDGVSVDLVKTGRAGKFVIRLGDFTAETASDPREGVYVALDAVPPAVAILERVEWRKGPTCVHWFGVGEGDDTAAFSGAAALSAVVLCPHVVGGYEVNNSLVNASDATFMFEGGGEQISGTATAEQLKAVFVGGGQVGGVPWADALRSSKLGIVAGAIRQNGVDRKKWDYISDGAHVPVGLSGDNATAAGGAITLTFDKTYGRVISFVCGPDETLGNVMGVSVGASVGLSSAILSASATFNGAFTVEWDGAAGEWVFSVGTGQNIAPALVSYVNGSLRVGHSYCRGIGVQVSPYTAGGEILNPFIPALKAAGNQYFDIQWIDPATGSVVTGLESERMKAAVTKVNNLGLYLDGTNGATEINGVDMSSGNIWFFGIFEK